jgi:hypothetical protein
VLLLGWHGPCVARYVQANGGLSTIQFTDQVRLEFVHAMVGAGAGGGSPAQQAVQAALLAHAGVPCPLSRGCWPFIGVHGPANGSPACAAVRRAAGRGPARLARAHLGELRAGHVTLAQLP